MDATKRSYPRKRLKSKKLFYGKLILKLVIYILIIIFTIRFGFKLIKNNLFYERLASIETNYNIDESDIELEIEKIKNLADENPDYLFISKNISQLPESMIKLAAKTPEALGFIEGYLKQKPELCPQSEQLGVNSKVKYFAQWDRKWAYEPYCGEFIGTRGCAPTSIAMMLNGFGIDKNPKDIAQFSTKNGHIIDNMTAWSIMGDIAKEYSLNVKTIGNYEQIKNALDNDAILIASMGPGYFTSSGHMIVIVGIEDNKLIINDPNSPTNSNAHWDYEEISSQIKNIWSFTK
ncbi:MAG: C39 family peptidase [Tissierellia bacterium]|nr:C39 family peptidase [Tissierellia bacterium]